VRRAACALFNGKGPLVLLRLIAKRVRGRDAVNNDGRRSADVEYSLLVLQKERYKDDRASKVVQHVFVDVSPMRSSRHVTT
jgi:hypothetical protein